MLKTEQRSTEPGSDFDLQVAAEELAEIVMHMQRKFLHNLSEELGHGNVSFPQYFLLGCLEKQEMITMSGIATRMGHTTAAATGLVDRLEKLGYVQRSHAQDDRRKVMVKITKKGSGLVAEIRRDMVNRIMTLLREYLTAEEGRAWLQIYRKIADCSDKLPKR
ncbi:MAG: MarR family transcriptional regulator [Verrucomicrobia bacterium]|nr:MarR family transcriptional regulator [Verrucomicrobiota bacterium]MBV8375813.1 MarR family transcriptional regulator [Verrucomicrobiota bacterium]